MSLELNIPAMPYIEPTVSKDSVLSPEEQVMEQIVDAGLLTPGSLVPDGKIHRFRADATKEKANENGWYILSKTEKGYLFGAVGDWAMGIKVKLSSHSSLSFEERVAQDRAIENMIRQAEEEKSQRQKRAEDKAREIWASSAPAPANHPYLIKKNLKGSYGARINKKGDLIIPVMDGYNNIVSLESIDAEGNKKFLPGGRKSGCFWQIGEGQPVYMAEGFATAASIYEATGKACVVAYDAFNLSKVSPRFPYVTIVADNDESKTGEKEALKTGLKTIVIPELGMDANDYVSSGKNLKALLEGISPSYRLLSGLDVVKIPKPKRWLIKDIVLREPSLNMIFGESGKGKTFVVVDVMMNIATGQVAWSGKAVHKGRVLYLCGEGFYETLERIRVWIQTHGKPSLEDQFMMSEQAAMLDTSDGLAVIQQSLEYHNFRPDLIVVDTLNRFMSGDENSTQDSSLFIRSCAQLSGAYGCNVLLVHHSGLTDKDRARGSSAFLGALDTQLKVVKNGENITVVQTKNKGGRLVDKLHFALEDHELEGEFDEDGAQLTSAILIPVEASANKEEEDPKVIKLKKALVKYFCAIGVNNNEKTATMQQKDLRELMKMEIRERWELEGVELITDEALKNNVATPMRRLLEPARDMGFITLKDGVISTEGFMLEEMKEPFWSMNLNRGNNG